MGDVIGDVAKQAFECHRSSFRMISNALKVVCAEFSKNWGHVAAHGRKQPNFGANVTSIIRKSSGEDVWIAAKERWTTLSDDPLYAIGIDRLEVGEVAYHLAR